MGLTSLSFSASSLVNSDVRILIHLLWWGYEKIKGIDSHVVQHTPATVGITSAEALNTCTILFTGLHWDLDHLERRNDKRKTKCGRSITAGRKYKFENRLLNMVQC